MKPTAEQVDDLFRVHKGLAVERRAGAASDWFETRSWADPSGRQLSDRVWNQRQGARAAMDGMVRDGIARGESAVSLARRLERYLDPSLTPTRTAKGRIVTDGRSGVLTDTPGRPRISGETLGYGGQGSYPARRLARTEITRSHGLAQVKAAEAVPGTGVRWRLSNSHPKVDICDRHAAKDGGFGAGIYFPFEVPAYPPHPHCLCSLGRVNLVDADTRIARLRGRYGLNGGVVEPNPPRTPPKPPPAPKAAAPAKRPPAKVAPKAAAKPAPVAPAPPPVAKAPKPKPKAGPAKGKGGVYDAFSEIPEEGTELGTQVRTGLDAINKTHRVPLSKHRIPFEDATKEGAAGTYEWDSVTGASKRITARAGKQGGLATVHETGHLIDQQFLSQFGTRAGALDREVLADFLATSKESKSMQRILQNRYDQRATVQIGRDKNGNPIYGEEEADNYYIKYLLSDDEVFARAYSQYVAKKSGDPLLRRELEDARRVANASGYPELWEDDDFEPIEQSLDRLFAAKGWLL